MKGTIQDVKHDGPEGRFTALVLLDGEDTPREVHYWPELAAQWGADKLRRFLIVEASRARDVDVAAAAAVAAADDHLAQLAGAADVDPKEFEPEPDQGDSDGAN